MRSRSSKAQLRRALRLARTRRSGVVLLVVLGLMALFALVGVTFVITAGQYKTSTVAQSADERVRDPYDAELNIAMEQVLYGTLNRFSVIGPHSLLEDMYGVGGAQPGIIPANGFAANSMTYVVGNTTATQGTMMYFTNLPVSAPVLSTNSPQAPVQPPNTFRNEPGYYVGRVITMLSGACAGQSTRVTGYSVSGGTAVLRMLPFPGMRFVAGAGWANAPAAAGQPTPLCPAVGDQFVINGREFTGTGFGYNPLSGTGLLDIGGAGNEIALRPNPRSIAYLQYMYGADGRPFTADDPPASIFLPNEAWDAPDYQNMALAFKRGSQTPIPSFHRPALINYWIAQGSFAGREHEIILRPTITAHPEFCGSINPALVGQNANSMAYQNFLRYGPWDVDNDGDGVADSIWIDPGLPIQTDSLGRKFKRLVAVQVIDLDGRLNINANGTLNFPSTPASPPQMQAYQVQVPAGATTTSGGALAAGNTAAVLPVALGTDPSNISLTADDLGGTPMSYALMNNTEFLRLCLGAVVGGRTIEGRNGEGALLAGGQYPRPGITGQDSNYPPAPTTQTAGATGATFRGNTYEISSYFSPFDWQGCGALGLDYRGQPIWSVLAPAPTGFDSNGDFQFSAAELSAQTMNEQAEMDLSLSASRRRFNLSATTGSSVDNPFGLDEMELLLRRYDIDTAARSGRLPTLCPRFYSDPTRVSIATTDSWHTPVCYFAATPEILQGVQAATNPPRLPVNMTIMDMVWGKLKAVDSGAADGTITTRMQTLFNPTMQMDGVEAFAPELQAGRPMNINRTFGDQSEEAGGGDGVVDGPDSTEQLWQNSVAGPIPFWHGAVTSNNPRLAGVGPPVSRHRMAKQLFMLMMLVKPTQYADPQGNETLSQAQRTELTVRRIAQWAINVVDFRDADAIMTPFEYDCDPFNANGWNVDGNPSTDEGGDRRLVWGCESPDLLLTETKAFHNRHTADMSTEMANAGQMPARTDDPDMMKKDDTFDQTRLPQGSAFIELYCTRNPHNPVFPRELYSQVNPTTWALDLGRKSNAGGGLNPVWRIVVTKSRQAGPENNVRTRANALADSASMEPLQVERNPLAPPNQTFCMLPTTMQTDPINQGPPVHIDRIVWMANSAAVPSGNNIPNPELVYYNRNASPVLLPGRYAVVGSRPSTTVGISPTALRIDLNDFTEMRNNTGAQRAPYTSMATDIQPPLGIAVSGGDPALHQVPGAPAQPFQNGVPFSISEPLYNSAVNATRAASYYPLTGIDVAMGSTLPYGLGTYYDKFTTPLDDPFDQSPRLGGWDNAPLGQETLYNSGTTQNYKTVFLQRLANPLIEWNPEPNDPQHRANDPVNPYISVDWMPIDLTVMNTEEQAPQTADPKDTPGNVGFQARERGILIPPPPANEQFNIWPPVSNDPMTAPLAAGIFNQNLQHTFGYLNATYGIGWKTGDANFPGAIYKGDPQQPFPWLAWFDRPFASNLEMMQVPASRASRLANDFSVRRQAPSDLHYVARPAGYDKPSIPYGHLMNFFHSATATDPGFPNDAPDFHRALALMDVPPRYSGTQVLLDPRTYQFGSGAENAAGEFYPFYAPDNYFSAYREPGRVNLNTCSSEFVWLGITNRYSPSDIGNIAFWNSVVQVSRQGYVGAPYVPVNNLPTEFAQPFLQQGEAYHVPIAALKQNGAALRRSVESGLMRPNPLAQDHPLLSLRAEPVGFYNPGAGKGAFNDTDRNSYFRYQPMSKFTNLVTGRSNVYAVWITVGYFEVRERAADPVNYPDGYEILAELNSDTGNVERHRAFYIIDRSIPVGFQRGVRHNAMETVRLQRIIE